MRRLGICIVLVLIAACDRSTTGVQEHQPLLGTYGSGSHCVEVADLPNYTHPSDCDASLSTQGFNGQLVTLSPTYSDPAVATRTWYVYEFRALPGGTNFSMKLIAQPTITGSGTQSLGSFSATLLPELAASGIILNDTPNHWAVVASADNPFESTFASGDAAWAFVSGNAVFPPANQTPTASFTVTAGAVSGGCRTYSFNAGGSSDPDGQGLSYIFSYGDGSGLDSAMTSSRSHAYCSAGSRTVRLRVNDGAGGIDVASVVLNVTVPSPLDVVVGGRTTVRPNSLCSYSATAMGGTAPFTFRWYKNTSLVRTATTTTPYDDRTQNTGSTSFWMTASVTDGDGAVARDSVRVTISSSASLCPT